MMWSIEFAGIGAFIAAVVPINLQAMQELLRAENLKIMLKMQQRYARNDRAVLMQSTRI